MPGVSGVSVVTNACAYYHCARGCGCAGTRHSPRPLLGERFMHNSGASRRENAIACLKVAGCLKMESSANRWVRTRRTPGRHRPRKRAIQYSRDGDDGIEKPRRTGYPAGACHRARRRRDPVARYDDLLWGYERATLAGRTTVSAAAFSAAKSGRGRDPSTAAASVLPPSVRRGVH
jgi:hypothetical protein